jgi:predicted AAA+ superfamily ATPase
MKEFQRIHLQALTKRLKEEPRRFIQVLYGPRQVGKTTLAMQMTRQIGLPFHFASADAVEGGADSWVAVQWERARFLQQQSGAAEAVLLLDEIQKIASWSEQVKREWDADTRNGVPVKVVLLGSSRLLLQQGLTESLAGRFETIYMGHWSLREMREAFGFSPAQYVWFGGYPGAAALAGDEERWKRYVVDALIETSIARDILLLTRVDKPALLRRLFELGCQYSGQILSFTKLLGQLQDAGNTVTLSHYLRLLDTAGLLGGLEKYAAGVVRQRASSPKFQVHNTALISAQQGFSMPEIQGRPAEWGRWVESAVGAHLMQGAMRGAYSLYYWREGDREVDFVLERKGRLIALEVKSAPSGVMPGMDAFRRRFHPDKVYLIGPSGIPWEELLGVDAEELF